jgi:hypothetical protein
MDYFEQYEKYNVLSSKMTGYFAAKAMYDSTIPIQARKQMLNCLIRVWKEVDENDLVVKGWIEIWERHIEELSA